MFAKCEGHGRSWLDNECTAAAAMYVDIDFINLYISYYSIKFRFCIRYVYGFTSFKSQKSMNELQQISSCVL